MEGRVLVVSADPARRRTFRDNLFLAGHAVFDVPNRSAALEACEDFDPSAVVIDLAGSRRRALSRLARGGTSKTSVNCNLIRQIASQFPSVRIIAVCDTEDGSSPQQAVEAGARDYLKEPICIGELLVRVYKHLGISTQVKKLRRPTPGQRKRIVLRSRPAEKASMTEIAAVLEEQLASLESPAADDAVSAGASDETRAGPTSSGDSVETPAEGRVEAPAESPTPGRLSDLIPASGSSEAMTMVWVGLGGLDRLATLGTATFELVSSAVDSVIEQFVPGSSKWWAGSEAVAVFTRHLEAPGEAAVELKSAMSEKLESLGLAGNLALRVSATSRRWGEGRALFLARATGRISNGGLPVSPFGAGSAPHPLVALPAGAAEARRFTTGVRTRATT